MTAIANLFLDDTLISEQQAPQRVLEAQWLSSDYHAVLKKRFGHITANDFLKHARRFSVLCNEIYCESNFELIMNKEIPLGFASFMASQGVWEGAEGKKLDLSQLTTDVFIEIFMRSSSMVLNIKPKIERKDNQFSFAQMEWTRQRPKTIFFYAQGCGQMTKYNRGPLADLLLRKMFYVSGVAPSFNFVVKLGLKTHLHEVSK